MSTQDNVTTDGERDGLNIAEVHCVAAVAEATSAHSGEVQKVVFDPEVLSKWVYGELLEVIEADGYELVGFGAVEDESEADFFGLSPEYVAAPIGVFVYRGQGSEE